MLSVAVVVRCAQASRYPASDRGLSLRDGAEACHKLVIIFPYGPAVAASEIFRITPFITSISQIPEIRAWS